MGIYGNKNKIPSWEWEWEGVRMNVDGNGMTPIPVGKNPTDFVHRCAIPP